jgi:hypothetical protein
MFNPYVFLLLFLAFESQASQRFLSFEALGLEQKTKISSLQKATHLLETQNGRCTGTTISTSGDLLTAKHCLQACLIRQGVYQQKVDPKSVEYYVLNKESLGKAECVISVDGKESNWIVKHTSPGLITKFEERSLRLLNRELFDLLRSKGYLANGDFVILSPKEKQNSPCISIAGGSSATNEDEVFTMGFPSETFRSDGNNSNGNDLFYSSGKMMNFAEGNCFAEAKPEKQADLLEQFNEPGTFVSDLDAIYGSSGSGVFNAKNQMIGILTNVYSPSDRDPKKLPENHFCSGSAKALKLSRIQELVGEEFSTYRCEEVVP